MRLISLCLCYYRFCLDMRHDRWRMIQEPFSIRSFAPLLVAPFFLFSCGISSGDAFQSPTLFHSLCSLPFLFLTQSPIAVTLLAPLKATLMINYSSASRREKRNLLPSPLSLSLSLYIYMYVYAVMIWIDLNGLFEWVCICVMFKTLTSMSNEGSTRIKGSRTKKKVLRAEKQTDRNVK